MGALGIVALLGTGGAPARRAARLRRPVEDASGPGRPDDGVPAVARRLPADRRLHRQVVHLLGGRPGRALRLAIIGVLSSVVSVFFYLRIVVMMYMTEEAVRPGAPGDLRAGDGRRSPSPCSRRSTSACCPIACSSTRCSRFRRSSRFCEIWQSAGIGSQRRCSRATAALSRHSGSRRVVVISRSPDCQFQCFSLSPAPFRRASSQLRADASARASRSTTRGRWRSTRSTKRR